MNRRYRSAPLGEPAFEVERSNANFTINLLHSMLDVDEEALNITKADGSVHERGDSCNGQLWVSPFSLRRTRPKRYVGGMPGGVLPYMGYIGMCGPEGYGFSAVLVINRVSIIAILPPLR